jgi:hypothetical protein
MFSGRIRENVAGDKENLTKKVKSERKWKREKKRKNKGND